MKGNIFRLRLLSLIILVLMLLGSIAALPAYAQDGPPGLARAIEVQQRNTPGLMANPGVVGTGVALAPDSQAAVVILLRQGGPAGLPTQIEGVPVVIRVTGEIYALAPQAQIDRTARFPRPVPIGVSTGHPSITAGTIGARVTNGSQVFALSNNHVYAASNSASIGDPVLQPGTYDGGSAPDDVIGNLYAFAPIVMSTSANNVIDAAIASTTTSLVGTSTPADGYGTPTSTPVSAALGMSVQKYGRTTGHTFGTVDTINATVNVCFSSPCQRPGSTARFVNQIIITPGTFSAGGDSGSLIVDSNRNPVGLLFAGSSSYTIANPISAVLSYFGVSIDSSSGPPPNTAPSVTISSPANGSTFAEGATISFSGSASDTQDGNLTANLVWTSSLDGQIGTGGSFSRTLSVGTHTITASVTDSGGLTGSASVSVTVSSSPPPNTAPSVTISSPANGSTFAEGATISFSGSASDTQDGNLTANLVWTSSLDGQIGTGGSFSRTLSVGTHTITASVTDSGGLTGSASVSVTVSASPPPADVTVTGITPNSVQAGSSVNVTISGSGFAAGAAVALQNGTGPTPQVSNVVVVNANTITATISASSGGPPRNRVWDVRVTNSNGSSGVLAGGFTVTP